MKKKRVAFVGALAAAALALSSCSNDENLRPLFDSPSNTNEENQNIDTGNSGTSEEGTEGGGEGGQQGGSQTDTTLPVRIETEITIEKPADAPTEMWWARSQIMDWFFNMKPGEIPSFPEEQLAAWTLYKNSDVESEEDYNRLVEQGKQVALQWLTGTVGGERGALPPAEGVTLKAASAAKSAQVGPSGEQLYRVAVLWSARKDRYGKPLANQMVEMFFTGSSGNWRFVSCRDVGPDACVPLFQTIL